MKIRPFTSLKNLSTRSIALVMITMLLMAALPVSTAFAASSPTNNAGTGASVTAGAGSVAWTTPGNITAVGSPYAQVTLANTTVVSEYLEGTNYGFAIPSSATITGITVTINRQSSSTQANNSINDNVVSLIKGGTLVGTDKGTTSDWSTSFTPAIYGSSADLWGTTWTPEDINSSNFGVALSVVSQSNSGRTASVDYMQITVTYTVASSGKFPTVGTDVAGVGTLTWTAPGNITADDTSYATQTASGTTHYLEATGYGFAIPTDATISGVTVTIGHFGSSTSGTGVRDSVVSLIQGGVVVTGTGSNLADTLTNWPTTATSTATYGSETNLWGTTWTPAQINASNFGVALSAATNGKTASVDYIQVAVAYSVPVSTTLTVAATTGTFGGTVNLSATLSPAASGKTINFTLNGSAPVGAVTNSSGIATLNGASLSGISVGSYATGVGASFAGDSNYAASSNTGSLTVNKATPTVSVTGGSFTYTGSSHAASGFAYGIGGITDTLTPSVTFSYSGTGATSYGPTSTAPTNAGTYLATASFAGNSNYVAVSNSAAITISKAAASIGVTPYTVTYDGASHIATGTATGVLSENLSGLVLTSTTHTNAGDYASDAWTFTDVTGNYNNASGTVHDSIAKVAATVTADAKSKVYGDDNPALSAVVAGTINSDTLNYTLATTAVKFSNAGPYPITVSLGSNPNYNVTKTDGVLAVGTKAASVTADAKSKVYGDNNPALSASVSGTVNSDTLDYTLATDALKFSDVGDYSITVSLGLNPNYTVATTDNTLTIDARPATVTANDLSKAYGDDNPALAATVNGAVNGDLINYTLATDALKFSDVGGYPITITLGSNSLNYSVTKTDGTLTIDPKAASITADAKSKTYGDDNPALSAVVAGTVNGDTLAYGLATAAQKFSGAGGYPITISLGSNPNYDVTKTESTLTVDPKAASVTPHAAGKTYGDDNPAFSATVGGTVNGDTLNFSLVTTALKFSDVGDYPVTVSLGLNPNYNVTVNADTLTIGPKAASITAHAQSKVYGDDNPTFTATVGGTVNGDTLNYSLTTAALKFSDVGDYPITVSLGLNPNYNVSATDNTLSIGKKAAAIAANDLNKAYGDDVPALSATVGGAVNGDILNYTLATDALKFSNVGGYPITVTLDLNPNYSVTKTDGTLTVDPRAATVVADSKHKTYGDSNPALSATEGGTVNGDTLNYNLATTAQMTSDAGSYPITISLGLNPNYSVIKTDGTLTIDPKAASVMADPITKIYGDPDPVFTGSLSGFLASDNVTATYDRAAGETVAGGPYTISATLHPAGALPNYDITYYTATLTIDKRAASVTPDTLSKSYGDADPTLTGSLSGFLPADGVMASYGRVTGEKVGGNPYIITAALDPAGMLGNYEISANTANFTINPKHITVSGVSANDKIYNGDASATLNTSGAALDTGVISPDVVNLDTSLASGTFADKNVNVGPAKPVAASGFGLTGADSGNYLLDQPTGLSANITPFDLTASAAADAKTYDATKAVTVHMSTNKLGTDDVTAAYTLAEFDTASAGTGKSVTISGISLSGGDQANYHLPNTTATASADINQASLTVKANNGSKVTGATLTFAGTEFSTTPSTLFGTDTLTSVTLTSTGAADTAPDGDYDILASAPLVGTGLTNYAISFEKGILTVSATINNPPVITEGTATSVNMSENGKPTPFSLSLHATDVDATDTLTWSLVSPTAAHGTASVAGTGSTKAIGYIPGPNFFGTDSFGVQVSDGHDVDSITVTVNVSRPILTVRSNGPLDGQVLELGENSNIGGLPNSASTLFNLGDDAANKQYRAILSFNTAGLPDNAIITSVTLKIKQQGVPMGANPFLTMGNLLVDIKKGNFGTAVLQAADFQALASKNSALTFINNPVGGWYTRAMATTGFPFVNKVGNTQFRLHFAKDDNNNHLANYLKFFSGNAPAASQPVLVIQYYVP